MFRFFSKIRYQLAAQNRVAKYLRYAVGEILLVVIGILIALQVNNWNESRKLHKNDIDFLRSLDNEIVIDTAVLNSKKQEFNGYNNEIKNTLKLYDNAIQLSESEINTIGSSIRNIEKLTPYYKNVERNDIKLSEGVLERLDTALNQKYILYLEQTRLNNDVIRKLGESLQLIVIHDVNPKIDYNYFGISNNEVNFSFQEIRYDRMIRNALTKSISYRDLSINYIDMQIVLAADLLEIINRNLDKN